MALRALLFSSDGSSTSALCKVLTDLEIEAEICPELLVAAERVSRESYDAILVDWERESEAIVLLKTARDQKRSTYQALNLALVQNDKDLPRALQAGANSAIRKPIDPQQAHDTLSTARDLILSRQAEQKQKEARAAAFQAEAAAVAAEFPDGDEPPVPKTGFLAQTAPRSAFEVEEKTEKHESDEKADDRVQAAAAGAGSLTEVKVEALKPRSFEKKRWDERPVAAPALAKESAPEHPRSQDTTHVFSSLPEEEETESAPEPARRVRSQYVGFALVGCVLVVGVLWVWAPGDSYRSRVSSIRQSLSTLSARNSQPQTTAPATAPAEQAAAPAKATDSPADPEPAETPEIDPSKIQIIETKSIPKSGSQQPPTYDPPPDSDQAKQSVAATDAQTAASADPPQPAPQPQVQPVVIPISRPQPPPPQAVPNPPAASEGRVGVVIPDSLRNTPSAAPASSLEPPIVPEETSRDLVLRRFEPEYPAQALAQRLTGQVVLQVWVARDGSVQDVKLVKGYFALAHAASDAVKQWRFRPFTPNGTPISFQTYVTLNFKYPG